MEEIQKKKMIGANDQIKKNINSGYLSDHPILI